MPKQARLSGIKSLRSYTIDEAAEVSGVSPRTIRNWAADGLSVMDGERPALVRGDDLRDFIKSQRKGRKARPPQTSFIAFAAGLHARQPVAWQTAPSRANV